MPKSAIKLIAWSGGAILLVLVCGAASCAIYSRYQSKKAQGVITTLNQAAIGTSSEAPIAALMNAGGIRSVSCRGAKNLLLTREPCGETPEQYGIYFGLPYWLNHVSFEHPLFQYMLRYSGMHPWFVEASLGSRDGKITRISYLTVVGRVDRATVVSKVDIEPKDLSQHETSPLYTVVYVQERNLIPELHAWISPALPTQERTRLTEFKMDCLGTVAGCLDPAEISPGLWYEYKRQSR